MPLQLGGRQVKAVWWTDDNGVPHRILRAYLSNADGTATALVWDGRIPAYVFGGPLRGIGKLNGGTVSAGASIGADTLLGSGLLSDAAASAGVAATADPITGAGLMSGADVSAGQSLVMIDPIAGSAQLVSGLVMVSAGISGQALRGAGEIPGGSISAGASMTMIDAIGGIGQLPSGSYLVSVLVDGTPIIGLGDLSDAAVSAGAKVPATPDSGVGQIIGGSISAGATIGGGAIAGTGAVVGGTVTTAEIARQRMNKSGNQNMGNGSGAPKQVTGWVSDPTHPATIASDEMSIVGAGSVILYAPVSMTSGSVNKRARLYRNTTELLAESATGPLLWAGSVQHLQKIRLAIYDINGAGAVTVSAAGTDVELIPSTGGPLFGGSVGDYDNSGSVTTVSLAAPAGSTMLIYTATNSGDGTVTVDGNAATKASTISSGITQWLYTVPDDATGSRSVVFTAGLNRSIIASYYANVTVVGVAGTNSGNSTGPNISPEGLGFVCVAGFSGTGVASGTSSGTIRRQQTNAGAGQYALALVDSSGAPVSMSLGSSTSWKAGAVWLA